MSCMLLGSGIVNGIINVVFANYGKTDTGVFKLPQSILRGYGLHMAETKFPSQAQLDELGRLLIKANNDGFSAAYSGRYDEEISDEVNTYRFTRDTHAATRDVGWLAKQITCFEYQAGDDPAYEGSEAHKWLAWALRCMLESMPTYKAAPWGYEGQEAA